MRKKKKLAVVVGDFQCEQFPGPYRHILASAQEFTGNNLLFIVRRPPPGAPVLTLQSPLDINVQATMISKHFPGAYIDPICQTRDKALWSERLNAAIAHYGAGADVAIYSDLSILDDYEGPHLLRTTANRITPDWSVSIPYESSPTFRRGIMYAAQLLAKARPRTFHTVDVAVVCAVEHSLVPSILLGRKSGETNWCLPGGHLMPSDSDSMRAATRELSEETGIHTSALILLGEFRVDDWRYRSESQPFTQLFLHYFNGQMHDVKAADDLAEVAWQPLVYPMIKPIVPEHLELLHKVWSYVNLNPPHPQIR